MRERDNTVFQKRRDALIKPTTVVVRRVGVRLVRSKGVAKARVGSDGTGRCVGVVADAHEGGRVAAL